MKFLAILFVALALLYILSPYDFLPDFFPIAGWLDDAAILGVLIYYLKNRRLPGFLSWLRGAPSAQNRYYRSDASGPEMKTGDPYEILGLKPGAGLKEIRAAYHKAAQAYHPDKVAHLGPELRELSQKKFIEIQKAYETLKRKKA